MLKRLSVFVLSNDKNNKEKLPLDSFSKNFDLPDYPHLSDSFLNVIQRKISEFFFWEIDDYFDRRLDVLALDKFCSGVYLKILESMLCPSSHKGCDDLGYFPVQLVSLDPNDRDGFEKTNMILNIVLQDLDDDDKKKE